MPARDRSFDVRQHVEAVRDRLPFHWFTPRRSIGQHVWFAATCGRSGAAGEAVRGRASFTPRPAVAKMAGASSRALDLALCLTPARWSARKMAASIGAPAGSGEWVATATAPQPCCNLQAIEIVTLFAAVAELQAVASRDARAYVCADARAYTRGEILQLCNRHVHIYVNQVFSGCPAVAARLQIGQSCNRPENGRFGLVQSNILAAGYRRVGFDGLRSGVKGGRGGESFGDFGAGARLEVGRIGERLARISDAQRVVGNGGNQPFLRVGSARVGMEMLEGCAQSFGFAGLSTDARKPHRLGAQALGSAAASWKGRGGDDQPAAPPMPPSRARPSPCSLAHAVFQIWTGYPALIHSGSMRSLAEARQGRGRSIGSGCGWRVRHPATAAPGRGVGGESATRQLQRRVGE